jgi:hypothetical protein
VLLATSADTLGTETLVLVCFVLASVGSVVVQAAERHTTQSGSADAQPKTQSEAAVSQGVLAGVVSDLRKSVAAVAEIWDHRLLRSAFVYAVLYRYSTYVSETSHEYVEAILILAH